MTVVGFQQHIDRWVDDGIPKVIDKEDAQENQVIELAAGICCGILWKEEQCKQRQPRDQACDPEHPFLVPYAFPDFDEQDKEEEYQGGKLKQEAQFIAGAPDAFQKNELIQGKDAQDDPVNTLIGKMVPERDFFLRIKGFSNNTAYG